MSNLLCVEWSIWACSLSKRLSLFRLLSDDSIGSASSWLCCRSVLVGKQAADQSRSCLQKTLFCITAQLVTSVWSCSTNTFRFGRYRSRLTTSCCHRCCMRSLMAQNKSLAMVDLLFFISYTRNLEIPSAISNGASRRHKASTASFTGSNTVFKSSRNANSVSDVSIAVDKSSEAFMMHLLRSRNLSNIELPVSFAVKDEGPVA